MNKISTYSISKFTGLNPLNSRLFIEKKKSYFKDYEDNSLPQFFYLANKKTIQK